MMFHEMSPKQKVEVNPKVVPLPILKAVLDYTWRAFGHDGYFMSSDDMEYMVKETGCHNPATSSDLMKIADEFELDGEHQEALFGAFVYLGYEVFSKDRRLVEYLKKPPYPRDVRKIFDQHPYKGVIGNLQKEHQESDIEPDLDTIKDTLANIESKIGRKTTDKERISKIKEIVASADDIHAMAYELHRLELSIELGRDVM